MSPTPSAVRLRLAVRRVRVATRRALAVVAAIVGVWLAGLFVFAASLPRAAPEDTGPTDAIVVLTGGSERLGVGFALLREGRAKKLFISGVYRGVEVRELLDRARQGEDLECCVVLGYEADDTEGNAVETARWARAEGFTSLRLVTANYHMPRSLVEFRRALPEVRIVPHPVVPPRVRLEDWWNWPGTADLVVGEYNKFLLAHLRAALTNPRAQGGGP